ncbi:hypothetical protein EYF80_000403 [Liparis tanakae]|uniref:Uncharacterized protein n=1 Tax=Liparis tanakae TaxID=230148 RepID=A0A4Z2JFT9_9TELE|nr:hypothetical protein EYF80_000403 [Liparis tanakae]
MTCIAECKGVENQPDSFFLMQIPRGKPVVRLWLVGKCHQCGALVDGASNRAMRRSTMSWVAGLVSVSVGTSLFHLPWPPRIPTPVEVQGLEDTDKAFPFKPRLDRLSVQRVDRSTLHRRNHTSGLLMLRVMPRAPEKKLCQRPDPEGRDPLIELHASVQTSRYKAGKVNLRSEKKKKKKKKKKRKKRPQAVHKHRLQHAHFTQLTPVTQEGVRKLGATGARLKGRLKVEGERQSDLVHHGTAHRPLGEKGGCVEGSKKEKGTGGKGTGGPIHT